MQTLSHLESCKSEPDTMSRLHDQQLLWALANAADAANAEYLALRSVALSRPTDIEAAQRHWLVLERLRRKLAARLVS